jgi:hypothetical protein
MTIYIQSLSGEKSPSTSSEPAAKAASAPEGTATPPAEGVPEWIIHSARRKPSPASSAT